MPLSIRQPLKSKTVCFDITSRPLPLGATTLPTMYKCSFSTVYIWMQIYKFSFNSCLAVLDLVIFGVEGAFERGARGYSSVLELQKFSTFASGYLHDPLYEHILERYA